MSPDQICPLKFWIRTDRSLGDLAESLRQCGVIEECSQDSENVYEWFTCTPAGYQVELNVSRNHHHGELDGDEPLGFLVIGRGGHSPSESIVREIAAAVHVALATPVFIGSIDYLGNDEFR